MFFLTQTIQEKIFLMLYTSVYLKKTINLFMFISLITVKDSVLFRLILAL